MCDCKFGNVCKNLHVICLVNSGVQVLDNKDLIKRYKYDQEMVQSERNSHSKN